MSFRNQERPEEEGMSVSTSSELFALGAFNRSLAPEAASEESALKKVCQVMTSLHEGFLSKCQNIEIFRNLTAEEQSLLTAV